MVEEPVRTAELVPLRPPSELELEWSAAEARLTQRPSAQIIPFLRRPQP